VLLLLENGPMREVADLVQQPWFKLYHFLASWRPDVDMVAWANATKGLAAHPQAFERQLDAVAALCPAHMPASSWDMLVEEQLRSRVRSGYAWEELLSSWVAMYCLVTQPAMAAATTAAAEALGGAGSSAAAAAGVGEQARPQHLPELDEFLLQMYALEGDPAAQLDALALYKPGSMSSADWDRAVGKVRALAGRRGERCLLLVSYMVWLSCHAGVVDVSRRGSSASMSA
jgi:hypothetical protein